MLPEILQSQRTYYRGSLIGRGGFADVYRGWFELADGSRQPCAIKCLQAHHYDDEEMLARFADEAALSYRVSANHPQIVTMRDFSLQGPNPFLVMDLVEGPALHAIKDQFIGNHALVRIVAQDMLLALEHIHDGGLIHRDISPANVLIEPSGVAMVTDLGIAKPIDATPTGQAIGVRRYAAPEVLRWQEHSPASDLYSFGVVLFELLTGKVPAPSSMELLADVPDDLATICRGCLQEEASDRPSATEALALLRAPPKDSSELQSIVDKWASKQPTRQTVQPTPRKTRRVRKPAVPKWLVVAVLAGLLFAVAVVGISSFFLESHPDVIELQGYRDWANL